MAKRIEFDEQFKEMLANRHATELMPYAIEILEQIKEDFLDFADNVADNQYDHDKHHLWAYIAEHAIKVLRMI